MQQVDSEVDGLMEQASEALAGMSYLQCERLCVEALAEVASQQRWSYYARILLPLQEARRQRRMIAADGTIRIGTHNDAAATTDAMAWLDRWLDTHDAGCIAFDTTPGLDVTALLQRIRDRSCYVELLTVESRDETHWQVSLGQGERRVMCAVPAADASIRDMDYNAGMSREQASSWFLAAMELLGDTALETIQNVAASAPERVAALQSAIDIVGDHELLHQACGTAAREMIRLSSKVSGASSSVTN